VDQSFDILRDRPRRDLDKGRDGEEQAESNTYVDNMVGDFPLKTESESR
jgi:hypothetical protein